MRTQLFSFDPHGRISSKNFASDGFDQKSIIFYRTGELEGIISTGIQDDSSFVKNESDRPVRTKAKVVCESTAIELSTSLNLLELDFIKNPVPSTFCTAVEPCCAVIFTEATETGPTQTDKLVAFLIVAIIALIAIAIPILAYTRKNKIFTTLIYYITAAPLFLLGISMLIYSIFSTYTHWNLGLIMFIIILIVPLILTIISSLLIKKLPEKKWKLTLLIFTYVNLFYYLIFIPIITMPMITY